MPPVDRREYLKYSGSAAVAPLIAATRTEAKDAHDRDEDRPRNSGEVRPPTNLQVESATDPLGVEAVVRDTDTSGESASIGTLETSEKSQPDGRPGADWTDYSFESSFTIEDRAAGFVFRAQDEGNFYLWQIILDAEVPTPEPANGILRTHVFESGVAVIRENVPFELGDPDAQHTCRIDLDGQQITTYVDGDLLHTTVDATYVSGTIGFMTDQREHFLVDEVSVVDPDGDELFASDFLYDTVRYFSGGTIGDNQLSLEGDDVVLRADRESSDEPEPPQRNDPTGRPGAPQPRLSWEFVPARRGLAQAAYQVLVASNEQRLRSDRADKWDSGKVETSDAIHVPYDGDPLTSGERVYWKVRVWDDDGRVSEWSEVATWEMGLLDAQDWTGEWIAAPSQSDQARLADQWTDYTVETTFTIGEGGFGIPFRARDSYNCYLVEVVPGTYVESPRVRFKVRERGQWETLSDEALEQSLDPNTTHTLRVEIAGNTYETYLDDEQINNTEDGRHSLGRFGFYTPDDIAATVEELVAQDPDGTVLHSDDFSDPETAIDYADGEIAGRELRLDGTGIALLHLFHPFVTPSPLLRREVTFQKPVEEARAYVSGLGFYELYLNGEHVGDQVLDPGRTDYGETVLYATHDVTEHLHRGDNAVGVALGRARFGEHTPNVWNWHDPPWWSDPQLRFQLEIEFVDGTTRTIASDGQWAVTDGPTRLDSLFGGEVYDARRERDGWTSPGYDDTDWDIPRLAEAPGGTLISQLVQPNEVTETLESVERTEPESGVYVFDVGQTIAGWIELTVEGPAGADVKLTTGEKLTNQGLVNNSNGNVNLPMQVDRYVLDGEGVETWESRFTYKGFRYVQVEGYPGTPSLEDVTAKVVHSALEEDGHGHFATSNELFEQIHENAHRAFLNNMHSVPTDTPKFEKNGWTGDALVTAEKGIYNFGMARFWRKWLRDCRDAQAGADDAVAEEGNVPVIVPTSNWGFEGWTPDPGWQSAYPLVAWWVYRYHGDERVLTEHYEGMKSYLEYLGEHTDGHIVRDGLGDWAAPIVGSRPGDDDTDNPLPIPPEGPGIVSTAYYYRSVQVTALAAEVLGREEEAAEFVALSEEIKEAFNDEFFYPGADVYLSDGTGAGEVFANTSNPVPNPVYRQTSNVMPLAFDMVPEGHKEGVVDNLVRNVEVANNGHLNTGVHGTKFLLRVLTEHDHHDVAYTVASQRTYPSWGWWIENGMTALLEFWSLDARSRDHHFLGTVDEWFYRYLAGIRAPDERGFGHVEIAPELVDDLEWVEASTDTVRGEVAVRWEQSADSLDIDVTVPGTAAATVRIPDLGADSPRVSEGGTTIWAQGRPERPFPAGIKAVSRADNTVVVEVGAGEYAFALIPGDGETNAVASRVDDGAIFTGGQTNRVDLTVTGTESVRMRDRVPDGWTVAGGDAHRVYTVNGTRYVEFVATGEQVDVTYVARAPGATDEADQYTFGPIEVAGEDGEWLPVSGTSDSLVVVGPDSDLLTSM